MMDRDLVAAEALGAGGAHEVGLRHLQHRGSHDARVDRGIEEAERQGRQDQVVDDIQNAAGAADLHHAADRQPAEFHRKQHDQHDAEPEAGCGVEEHGADRDQAVPEGADFHRSDDACRDAHRDGERDARHHQQDGCRQVDPDCLDDRHVLPVGETEVEMQQRPDVLQKLHPHGIFQPVCLAQQCDRRRIAHLVLGRHQLEEAARCHLDQAEIDDHHAQHQRDGLNQPSPQELERCRPAGGAAQRGRWRD